MNRKDIIKKVLKIVIIVIIMIALAFIYSKILSYKNENMLNIQQKEKEKHVFDNVERDEKAYLDLYTIYGNHLNINGHILKGELSKDDISNISLLVRDLDENVIKYDLEYEIQENNIEFRNSEKINEGIDLNKLNEGKYYIFVDLEYTNEGKIIDRKYSLINTSEYNSGEYYSLTQNGTNNKISISFNNYKDSNNTIEYMAIQSKSTQLPSNVYDIVIDPGHGGKDCGATHNNLYEDDITLDYSIELKNKLEELGYKVKLTREKDEYVESYGNTGRSVIPYVTKAKLVLSIHLNSTSSDDCVGGVEIYAPNKANLSFAKSFADKIVVNTNGKYSVNSYAKALDGVYVRTYTQSEIEDAIEYANNIGYTPYETLSTQTPYLFMIRETGGIITQAYVDGRNKNLGENPYYKTNIAAEGYLLELGFINSQDDVNKLLNNKEEYINAITEAIVNNYE